MRKFFLWDSDWDLCDRSDNHEYFAAGRLSWVLKRPSQYRRIYTKAPSNPLRCIRTRLSDLYHIMTICFFSCSSVSGFGFFFVDFIRSPIFSDVWIGMLLEASQNIFGLRFVNFSFFSIFCLPFSPPFSHLSANIYTQAEVHVATRFVVREEKWPRNCANWDFASRSLIC